MAQPRRAPAAAAAPRPPPPPHLQQQLHSLDGGDSRLGDGGGYPAGQKVLEEAERLVTHAGSRSDTPCPERANEPRASPPGRPRAPPAKWPPAPRRPSYPPRPLAIGGGVPRGTDIGWEPPRARPRRGARGSGAMFSCGGSARAAGLGTFKGQIKVIWSLPGNAMSEHVPAVLIAPGRHRRGLRKLAGVPQATLTVSCRPEAGAGG